MESTNGSSGKAKGFLRRSRSVGRRGSQIARIRRVAKNPIVTVPLHYPLSGLSVPVAREGRLETRAAPVFDLLRGCRTNMPACFRGAWLRIHLCAQEKGGDAFLLCAQHQPARGREIE